MTGSRYDQDPEAIAWARQYVEGALERLAKAQQYHRENGNDGKADGIKYAEWDMRRHLLGGQGCVVAAFDTRRPEMEALFARGQERNQEFDQALTEGGWKFA